MHIDRRLAAAAAICVAVPASAVAVPALAKSRPSETLSNFKITGSSSARAGAATFKVRNTSSLPHELIVIRTKRKAGNLKTSGGRASEKGAVGEVEVAPGKSGSLKVRLKKGHYALICNVGRHYSAGMHKDFTVK